MKPVILSITEMSKVYITFPNARSKRLSGNPREIEHSGQLISRILSRVGIYLGTLSPAYSSGLPGDQQCRASTGEALFPCLTLHRKGVAWPRVLLPAPVVSYTTFSPLHACDCSVRNVSVARSRSLRLSRSYLASCSMVYGLSSLLSVERRTHPADLCI